MQLVKKVREYHRENTQLKAEIARLKSGASGAGKSSGTAKATSHHYPDKREKKETKDLYYSAVTATPKVNQEADARVASATPGSVKR